MITTLWLENINLLLDCCNENLWCLLTEAYIKHCDLHQARKILHKTDARVRNRNAVLRAFHEGIFTFTIYTARQSVCTVSAHSLHLDIYYIINIKCGRHDLIALFGADNTHLLLVSASL